MYYLNKTLRVSVDEVLVLSNMHQRFEALFKLSIVHSRDSDPEDPAIWKLLENFLRAQSFTVDALEDYIRQISSMGTMSVHVRRILLLK